MVAALPPGFADCPAERIASEEEPNAVLSGGGVGLSDTPTAGAEEDDEEMQTRWEPGGVL